MSVMKYLMASKEGIIVIQVFLPWGLFLRELTSQKRKQIIGI